jgi:hypothetical protein
MPEQIAVEQVTEASIRRRLDAARKRKVRAKARGDQDALQDIACIEYEARFDLERLSKHGGLIEIEETKPFVDCTTLAEFVNTSRIFAYAFRQAGVKVPDLQPREKIHDFLLRVHQKWYDVPLGDVFHFVRLDSLTFDDDMGFSRDVKIDWTKGGTWERMEGDEETVDVATLPQIGKPDPEWFQKGFDSYLAWREDRDEKARLASNHAILERSLHSKEDIDKMLGTTKTPEVSQAPKIYIVSDNKLEF